MPEQRQGAGAIVRQPEPDDFPRDSVPPKDVGNTFAANRLQAVPPSQHFHIGGGGRLHRAFCRRWPLAEGQHLLPPGLITETSLRNARARALVGTCIHTALSRSLLLRLILPRAGRRFHRSLFRQRAHGKQWSMCGEDRIRDADHTQASANPPSRNCFARSSATLVS